MVIYRKSLLVLNVIFPLIWRLFFFKKVKEKKWIKMDKRKKKKGGRKERGKMRKGKR